MFFRHAKHVVDEFMTLPNLLSPEAYLKDPWIGHDAGKYVTLFTKNLDLILDICRGIGLFPFRIYQSSADLPLV